MENASYIALSRQATLREQLAVTAQNVANLNTPGYKAQRTLFVEYLAEPEGRASRYGVDPAVSMVIDQAVLRDIRPGPVDRTGNTLDVALVGDGYLVVETPAGPRYTRNGRLSIDIDRRLVDGNGLPILDKRDREITIPQDAGEITILEDGTITTAEGEVGQLQIVAFDRANELIPLGGNLLTTNQVPQDAVDTRVAQGMVERSNIQAAVEMTRLIEVSRAYERAGSLIKSEHDRQRDAIKRLGRLDG